MWKSLWASGPQVEWVLCELVAMGPGGSGAKA